mmetsp:Transcript_33618/g.81773  ORF Transcript_33618/g.81773 Transcript_33618/m.81773 type:complete len:227 (-) Transcript_33618:172-852(-)
MGGKGETDAKGIPLAADHAAAQMGLPVWLFYLFLHAILGSVGFAIAQYAVFPREPKSCDKMKSLASLDLGWLYLGACVLKMGHILMRINLAQARVASKVNVPDQQVYQVKGAEGSKLGYVLMETEGAIGAFNRAQRALQTYNEGMSLVLLMFVCAGYVCPFSTFVCAFALAASRLHCAVGYTSSADGRMPGTLISAISQYVLESIVFVSGLSAVEYTQLAVHCLVL